MKMEKNGLMSERIQPTEDEILNEICVCVGSFKIPKTVGDVGILFNQINMPSNAEAHRVLRSSFEPYKNNVATLERKRKEWTETPHDHVIDPDARYVASQIIQHLHRELMFLEHERTMTGVESPKKITHRFAEALRSLGATF